MSRLPLIGITDCSQQSGLHAHHISGDIPSACSPQGSRAVDDDLSVRPNGSVRYSGRPDGIPITVLLQYRTESQNVAPPLPWAPLAILHASICGVVQNTIAFRTPEFQRDADASNIA
jgi:hypothetical protein